MSENHLFFSVVSCSSIIVQLLRDPLNKTGFIAGLRSAQRPRTLFKCTTLCLKPDTTICETQPNKQEAYEVQCSKAKCSMFNHHEHLCCELNQSLTLLVPFPSVNLTKCAAFAAMKSQPQFRLSLPGNVADKLNQTV